VLLSYGAANRDPERYEEADTLDSERRATHFSFGRGPHRCLGSHLARLELRVVLEEWHRRIPEYTLAAGARPRAPWPAGTLGLDSVQLTFPS
jgi:cytochrome P450